MKFNSIQNNVKQTATYYGSSFKKAGRHMGKSVSGAINGSAELKMSGRKGGKVERLRREERMIDLELRDLVYR